MRRVGNTAFPGILPSREQHSYISLLQQKGTIRYEISHNASFLCCKRVLMVLTTTVTFAQSSNFSSSRITLRITIHFGIQRRHEQQFQIRSWKEDRRRASHSRSLSQIEPSELFTRDYEHPTNPQLPSRSFRATQICPFLMRKQRLSIR